MSKDQNVQPDHAGQLGNGAVSYRLKSVPSFFLSRQNLVYTFTPLGLKSHNEMSAMGLGE